MNMVKQAMRMRPLNWAGVLACLTWGVFILEPDQAMAKPPLGKSWPESQRASMDKIDHSKFDTLLQKYVDDDGYVNYKAWKANQQERQALLQYLGELSRTGMGIPASKKAQLAFWINAYNAVTIEGILQEYPTSSIRNHTAKIYGYNIWKNLPLQVGNQQFSLEDIEHKILRKMNEPRIHFAIVCASVGCPRLYNRAYTSDQLEEQLTLNTKDFFSRSQNLRVDASRNILHVSSILNWFASDFGNSQQQRIAYWKPYMPAEAQRVASVPNVQLQYQDYNWSLNDQSKRQRR